MQEKDSAVRDVVVVGLGISGLSVTARLAEMGYSVIGVEKNLSSGSLGTSSAGKIRMFRITQIDPLLQEHAKYDYQEWRRIERVTNSKIVHITGGLNMGPRDFPSIKQMIDKHLQDGDEVLTAKEIMSRYPALKVDPTYVGIYSRDMGFIDVEAALSSLTTVALNNKASFIYNCEFVSRNEEEKSITVREGGV